MTAMSQTAGIHTVRTGPRGGTPIVLIHPVGLDLTYWGDQIEALGRSHDVVAYDLPGNGASAGTPADWTLDAAAATLARVAAATGAAQVDVVGISIGGMIAQAFALARPMAVRSLALIGTAASFSDEERRFARGRAAAARRDGMAAIIPATLERWFTPETRERRPDIVDRVAKSMRADDPAIYAAMWDMIASLDFAGRLGEIACPTLVMTGEADPICPPATAQMLHDGIAGSHLAVVPGAAHMCILEQPGFINVRLTTFLEERSLWTGSGA